MSKLTRLNWNSVVVGRWNPAILTPKGIATHIFQKEAQFPFEVLVPLDAHNEPSRIKLEGVIAQASDERFVIECEKPEWDLIEKARRYCIVAIEALPITPLSAAGYNLRYKVEEADEDFISSLVLPLDKKIADARMNITIREIKRGLEWRNGSINIHINRISSDTYNLLLNFDFHSTDNKELSEWLATPIDEVKKVSSTILCDILDILTEEDAECQTQPQH